MNNEDKVKIGKRIRDIRISTNKTMKEFGSLFSPPASDSIVSRWERGISVPNTDRLNTIAKIGNVTTDYVLTGEDYKRINLDLFKDLDKIGDNSNKENNNQNDPKTLQEKMDDLASLVENSPSSEAMKKISSMYNNKSEKAKESILSEVQNINQFKNFELISLNWHIILLKMYKDYPGVATNLSSLAHFLSKVKEDLENPTSESLSEDEIIEHCQRYMRWMIESITKEKQETE